MVSLHEVTGLRKYLAAMAGVGGLTLLAGVLLAAPVLHEYFDASAVVGATSENDSVAPISGFPSQVATPSGSVDAPPDQRPDRDGTYAQAQSENDQYRLDGDTSRPDLVGYSDPFTPSIPPFKRSFAYDTVTDDLELAVADPTLTPIKVGGRSQPGDDQFFVDLTLNLRPGEAVRVPSVGPQARILAAKLQPNADFELLRDSADNWYIRGESGEFRLVMHLAIERRVFGSPFAATSWRDLSKHLPELPALIKRHTSEVLADLELDQNIPPGQALTKLVEHFRSFEASDQRLASSGAKLYREIALSQKGVCRHRSFAFAVTALGLGIPTRFVRNEAHAWVETFDGQLWHRLDLGGAAGRMDMGSQVEVPHLAPTDPFSWPSGSESGQDMADQAMSSTSRTGGAQTRGAAADAVGSSAALQTTAPQTTTAPSTFQHDEPPSWPPNAMPPNATPEQPVLESAPAATTVSVLSKDARATRGQPVFVRGRVNSEGKGCDLTRVDIKLQDEAGQWFTLGTLVTDARGAYEGRVVVPAAVPVGDYELFAVTPGSQRCASGSSLESKRSK